LYIEVSAGKTDKNSWIMTPHDNGILPYQVFAHPITLAPYDRVICCVFNVLMQSARLQAPPESPPAGLEAGYRKMMAAITVR
jgi:hypothetical protein